MLDYHLVQNDKQYHVKAGLFSGYTVYNLNRFRVLSDTLLKK